MMKVRHRRFTHFRNLTKSARDCEQSVNYYLYQENCFQRLVPNNVECYFKIVWELMPFDFSENYRKVMEITTAVLHETQNFTFHCQVIRFAYFYLCFTCHVYGIAGIWHALTREWNDYLGLWFGEIFRSKRVNVFCFGGNDGSCIVGFNQWLKMIGIRATFEATVVDTYDWTLETQHLLRSIDPCFGIPLCLGKKFNEIRPFHTVDNQIPNRLKVADLVVVGKYLSFLQVNDLNIMHFKMLFNLMKPSALLFFVDEAGKNHLETMSSIAEISGLEKIAHVENIVVSIPEHELQAMNDDHFPTMPYQSMCACAGLWRKR